MNLRIADTFTDSLTRLTGDEQTAGDGARDHHPRACGDAGEQKIHTLLLPTPSSTPTRNSRQPYRDFFPFGITPRQPGRNPSGGKVADRLLTLVQELLSDHERHKLALDEADKVGNPDARAKAIEEWRKLTKESAAAIESEAFATKAGALVRDSGDPETPH